MTTRKGKKRQKMIYKTLRKKQKIQQTETHDKTGLNSGVPVG